MKAPIKSNELGLINNHPDKNNQNTFIFWDPDEKMGRSCRRMGCLRGWGCARSVKVPEKTAVAQCVVCSVVWRSVWCVGHSFPIVVTPPNHLCSPEEGGRGIILGVLAYPRIQSRTC